jgi:hypothetical protein
LSKEDGENLHQMLLAMHHESLSIMNPTNDPIKPTAFGVREQIMKLSRKLFGSTDPSNSFLFVFRILHHVHFDVPTQCDPFETMATGNGER